MRITYITHGTHWEASIEPVLETLRERGHEVIRCEPKIRNQEVITSDVVILTSNEDRPIITPNTRTVFIPHGIGDERWETIMNTYDKVLLAGIRPYAPGTNAKIVGWAKSDVLFNPNKEKEDYVRNLVSNLPYEHTIMVIPYPDDLGDRLQNLVNYFDNRRINVIAPYQEFHDNAQSYYKNTKNIVLPQILNLYYFVPYIEVLVCSGFTSIGREFYITQIPTIHIGKGFEETINLSNPQSFDPIFTKIWNNPSVYLQPNFITKQFIEIHDGKTVNRIIHEIESLCS